MIFSNSPTPKRILSGIFLGVIEGSVKEVISVLISLFVNTVTTTILAKSCYNWWRRGHYPSPHSDSHIYYRSKGHLMKVHLTALFSLVPKFIRVRELKDKCKSTVQY